MKLRASWLISSAALALLAAPHAAVAQQQGWTLKGTGEFGIFYATRDLAKNVGDRSEASVLQISTRLDAAPGFGAGIEVMSPTERLLFRGLVRQTIGGKASGQIAICALVEGEICAPQVVDAQVTSFAGEMVFVQGQPGDAVRLNFIVGGGARSYSFRAQACDPTVTNPDLFVICELATSLYEEQAPVQPFGEFGFGVSFGSGPVSAHLRVIQQIGPYAGGSGNSDGNQQGDVFGFGGMSLRVR